MSTPNTWAKCLVNNDLEHPIEDITVEHRYEKDHNDFKSFSSIQQKKSSESFDVGYWTGTFRTGYDYWFIRFLYKGFYYECKRTFYCYLTKDDANKPVTLRIYDSGGGKLKMEVQPASSARATVSVDKQEDAVAECIVKNETGTALADIFVRHKYDGREENLNCSYLEQDKESSSFRVKYKYGYGNPNYDYWYIRFRTDDAIFECKDSFYCYLEEKDAGQTVRLVIKKESNAFKMKVECPQSSQCEVKIERGQSSFVGGLIIIGSLYWDPLQKREDFRKQNLRIDQAVKIKFPTDYARISDGGETTMTISYPGSEMLGTAYFVPFKSASEAHTLLDDIIQKSKDVAAFEGVDFNKIKSGKYFTREWLAIGKLMNNKIPFLNDQFKTDLDKKWAGYSRGEDPKTSFRFSRYTPDRNLIDERNSLSYKDIEEKGDKNSIDSIPIGKYGSIQRMEWLTAVDPEQQNFLDSFSYALTCFLPPSFIYTANHYKKAGVSLIKDTRSYFFNNLASGIRTEKDYSEILTDVTSDFKTSTTSDRGVIKFYFNNLFLKPGQYIRNDQTVLLFDTKGKLMVFHKDQLVWFSVNENGYRKEQDVEGGQCAKFQCHDGNLVIYKEENLSSPVWCSGEGDVGREKYQLVLLPDGRFVIENTKFDFVKMKDAWKSYVTMTRILETS